MTKEKRRMLKEQAKFEKQKRKEQARKDRSSEERKEYGLWISVCSHGFLFFALAYIIYCLITFFFIYLYNPNFVTSVSSYLGAIDNFKVTTLWFIPLAVMLSAVFNFRFFEKLLDLFRKSGYKMITFLLILLITAAYIVAMVVYIRSQQYSLNFEIFREIFI